MNRRQSARPVCLALKWAEERHRAVLELETIACDEINRVRDAAYLLGIAVGRRLGPESLRLPAGGVR